jgi:arsenite methyltransferase
LTEFQFDEAESRRLEAVYLTPDVVSQRREVMKALQLGAGERVLDIGSGPGLLAAEMAEAVGPQGRVCGIDASDAMIAMARKRCAGMPWCEFQKADAGAIPYPVASFDGAVSTQVYEYVRDIPAALGELHRVLRPGGRVAILDTDYGSLVIHTEHPARMARILAAWDQHFVHSHLPRVLSRELREAGFAVRHRAAIPMFNPEFQDNTYGKGMLQIMRAFAVGKDGISESEADAWYAEFAHLAAQDKFFFSLNRYLFVAEKITQS